MKFSNLQTSYFYPLLEMDATFSSILAKKGTMQKI